jgi:hypothetical protein
MYVGRSSQAEVSASQSHRLRSLGESWAAAAEAQAQRKFSFTNRLKEARSLCRIEWRTSRNSVHVESQIS